MFHFAWPWLALILPLPWLLHRWRRPAKARGAALFMPFAAGLPGVPGETQTSSRLRIIFFSLIWLLLVGAAMRPQWLGEPQAVPSTGRRLLLAVDVSGSMQAQDMAGNYTRLQVVQAVAGRFIDGRRGDQVGLILFGTQPYLQAPLSRDLATVHQFLDQAMIGVAGTETAIGDAIGMAIKRLRAHTDNAAQVEAGNLPEAAQQTVLVLLTDGQNTAGEMPPLEAARMAAQLGLKIYTIGVGSLPEPGFFGSVGNNDLDEETLQSIAKTTGGEYFRASDANALLQVYQQIDQLEPAAAEKQWFRPAEEYFRWPLALALLLSLPAALRGGRRWN